MKVTLKLKDTSYMNKNVFHSPTKLKIDFSSYKMSSLKKVKCEELLLFWLSIKCVREFY